MENILLDLKKEKMIVDLKKIKETVKELQKNGLEGLR